MEHTEFSSICSSVGELNMGECVSRGAQRAAMHRNAHHCDTPTRAVSPPPCEKKNSPTSRPCTRELQSIALKGDSCVSQLGFQGGCLWVSSSRWKTVFCCSCLQITQGSISLCRFSPNLHIQGRCPHVEVAAREAPCLSTPYSRATLGWRVGFCLHLIFSLTFCLWSLKSHLLSPSFAVLTLWVIRS